MPEYIVSPFLHSIESQLDPDNIHQAVFHQLTGEVFVPLPHLHSFLLKARGNKIAFEVQDLSGMGDVGVQVHQMLDSHFLIPDGADAFASFLDHTVVRPIQNPALSYRSQDNQLVVVRLSMARRLCSPRTGQLPPVIEEVIAGPAADILEHADGRTTLRQIFESCGVSVDEGSPAVEFLTAPERQLIKLTLAIDDLDDPDQPFNAVPRNLYHAARWQPPSSSDVSASVEFHTHGIEDAEWEFNLIEPTVNHAFRFPSTALGGLDYGASFCQGALPDEVNAPTRKQRLAVLEVGGGTGTFARSFLRQATVSLGSEAPVLNYKILELSPVLAASQQKLLSNAGISLEHVRQDAVALSIPDHKFDLIILNEVVADFPTSLVRKRVSTNGTEPTWQGDGATYVTKYDLEVDGETDSFRINSGVFEFVERAWEHLHSGGRVIMTEYGSVNQLPLQMLHLNHEEFSIHFGHVRSCAEQVGFTCRLLTLAEFLGFDEQALMLAGQEEHIICLNHVLQRFDLSLPYAAITKADFDAQFQTALEKMQVSGPRFLPLSRGFYFGPRVDEFMVLIMSKP